MTERSKKKAKPIKPAKKSTIAPLPPDANAVKPRKRGRPRKEVPAEKPQVSPPIKQKPSEIPQVDAVITGAEKPQVPPFIIPENLPPFRPTTAPIDPARAAFAIQSTMGNISRAAQMLGLSRGGLHRFIKDHPDIKDLVTDAREQMCDVAESSLHLAVAKGESWAVCFTLKCLGKDRGYVERLEHRKVPDVDLTNMDDDELEKLEQSITTQS